MKQIGSCSSGADSTSTCLISCVISTPFCHRDAAWNWNIINKKPLGICFSLFQIHIITQQYQDGSIALRAKWLWVRFLLLTTSNPDVSPVLVEIMHQKKGLCWGAILPLITALLPPSVVHAMLHRLCTSPREEAAELTHSLAQFMPAKRFLLCQCCHSSLNKDIFDSGVWDTLFKAGEGTATAGGCFENHSSVKQWEIYYWFPWE